MSNVFKQMTDEYLIKNYIPDVYQPSIFKIDYSLLKKAGIKLISFDIDDTIAGLIEPVPSKEAKTLFVNLKNMGFIIELMSNNFMDGRVKSFAKKLGIEEQCISKAKKPLSDSFSKLMGKYQCQKEQMAHVGNSMRDDIAGGNAFGITTCLVRRAGVITKIPNTIINSEGDKLREELLNRELWRKHHKYEKDDQYYQLGEEPKYREK